MRVVLLGFLIAAGAVYGSGALYFFRHERTSQSLDAARSLPASEIEHPEATLALIRDGMEQRDYSPRVGELVARAEAQVPSFYQPHAYRATYHTARLEAPGRTREAFEAALLRFPANGRLHLDYARWLLMAPSVLPGVAGTRDEAERHLHVALELEPRLTPDALATLERYGVPPEHWTDIVPDTLDARRSMVSELARAGHREAALQHLRPLLARTKEAGYQRQAAYWALSWGDPELALEAVHAWRANSEGSAWRIEPHEAGLVEARARLRLGEMDAAFDVFRSTLNDVGPSSSAGLKLLCGMGEEYLRLGRIVLAESVFAEAAGYSPSYPPALLGLARVHRRQGDPMRAIAYYQKALQLDPENAAVKDELLNVMTAAGAGRSGRR